MTTLYLVRHCEALGNVLKQFQGSIDAEITENGAKQLQYLAERFKDIKIDKFYSSPLKRAVMTARAVADQKNMSVTTVDGLSEIHGGVLEGMTFDEIFRVYPQVEIDWDYNPHVFKAPGGESMREVYLRATKAIKQIISENSGKTVFVASHGGVIRNIMCFFLSVPFENLQSVGWSKNTGVNIIKIADDGSITVECENSLDHLPQNIVLANCFEKNPVESGEEQ